MPLPDEHACRLQPPGNFEKESFRRIAQGRLSIIIGKLKGGNRIAQAFRYPKNKWTAAAASKHCKANKGTFEAAGKA